jgi:hypothetical protein
MVLAMRTWRGELRMISSGVLAFRVCPGAASEEKKDRLAQGYHIMSVIAQIVAAAIKDVPSTSSDED